MNAIKTLAAIVAGLTLLCGSAQARTQRLAHNHFERGADWDRHRHHGESKYQNREHHNDRDRQRRADSSVHFERWHPTGHDGGERSRGHEDHEASHGHDHEKDASWHSGVFFRQWRAGDWAD